MCFIALGETGELVSSKNFNNTVGKFELWFTKRDVWLDKPKCAINISFLISNQSINQVNIHIAASLLKGSSCHNTTGVMTLKCFASFLCCIQDQASIMCVRISVFHSVPSGGSKVRVVWIAKLLVV